MEEPNRTSKPPYPKLVWGIPIVLPCFIVIAAVANWGAYWSKPMAIASIVAIIVSVISMTNRVPLGAWISMIVLSTGGVFASALQPDAASANGLMIGSIVTIAVMVAGSILSFMVQSATGSVSDSPPWDSIIASLQMSDNAKRVLFRDRELELLRKTVQGDIERGEFHSALVLCEQMSTIFGAVEEAEQLRTKVNTIIHENHEGRIREEISKLEISLDECKWVQAYQDAAKLRRLFPDSPLLHGIEQKISDVRTQYRHGLEDRFLNAAKRDDIELAMTLLRELDGYLTPDEARRFRDTADTVITTYRESLGARFKMAVSDHRWREAIEFGEEITHQFPNSKMAEEVKNMIESIRERSIEEKASS